MYDQGTKYVGLNTIGGCYQKAPKVFTYFVLSIKINGNYTNEQGMNNILSRYRP